MNIFDNLQKNVNKLLFGKVNKRKKEVEAKLVETPAFDTNRLDSLSKKMEKLEAEEKRLAAQTEEILARARKIVGKKKAIIDEGKEEVSKNVEKMKKDYVEKGELPFESDNPRVKAALNEGFKAFCEEK